MIVKLHPPLSAVSLWLIALDGEEPDEAVLNAQERLRVAKFHFERDARRYARARSALRILLGQHIGLRAEAIRFREGVHGKPHLDLEGCNAPFSISHSQGHALVAIGERLPIGVDIEAMRDDDPVALETLAGSVMTRCELEDWLLLGHDARRLAFYALWSAKEACLKSVGCGLNTEPRDMEVGWAPQPRDIVVPVAGAHASVRLFPLRALDGFAAALAVLHGDSAHLAS